MQSIWLEIKHHSNSFRLCSTYRPLDSSVSSWDDLNVSIERASDSSPNIILLGDLNENLLNENLVHLKNIIISNNVEYYKFGCYDIPKSVSGHRATFIFLKSIYDRHECLTRKVWYYNSADFSRLNELIGNENWDFIETLTVDESCETLTEIILKHMSEFIPSKNVTIRPDDKPWCDSELRHFSKCRDRLRKIALKIIPKVAGLDTKRCVTKLIQ